MRHTIQFRGSSFILTYLLSVPYTILTNNRLWATLNACVPGHYTSVLVLTCHLTVYSPSRKDRDCVHLLPTKRMVIMRGCLVSIFARVTRSSRYTRRVLSSKPSRLSSCNRGLECVPWGCILNSYPALWLILFPHKRLTPS